MKMFVFGTGFGIFFSFYSGFIHPGKYTSIWYFVEMAIVVQEGS